MRAWCGGGGGGPQIGAIVAAVLVCVYMCRKADRDKVQVLGGEPVAAPLHTPEAAGGIDTTSVQQDAAVPPYSTVRRREEDSNYGA